MKPRIVYKTHIEQLYFADKLFIVETIRDLDEAIDQLCDSFSEDEMKNPFAEDLSPYFGFLWPAAEGLCLHIEDEADKIQDKTILELGCGMGLPSMVAARLGAKVLASDYHPDVEFFFKRNLRHTNMQCDYLCFNWREDNALSEKYDIVMGSDILYESKHPRDVAQALTKFMKPNGKIWLADPGRSYLQKFVNAMEELGFKYELKPQSVGNQEIFVFEFSI